MAENKTKATRDNVQAFLGAIVDPVRGSDCMKLAELMEGITGAKAVMWGASIVGFGTYHYKYASGREGEWFQCGFSPRKQNLTIYLMGYLDSYGEQLKELGKYTHGKGCLYIKKLEDIDLDVLTELIKSSIAHLKDHRST